MIVLPGQSEDRLHPRQVALNRLFLGQAGGDRELADQLRRAHFSEMGKRSGSRRRAKAAKRRATELAALRALGVEFTTDDELLQAARALVKR